MHYSDHEQRQLDIKSGEALDRRRMYDPILPRDPRVEMLVERFATIGPQPDDPGAPAPGPAASEQSRRMSLIESLGSTAIGLLINTTANFLVLPLFGLHPSIVDSLLLACIFTILSVARGFVLRRLFEHVRIKWGNI